MGRLVSFLLILLILLIMIISGFAASQVSQSIIRKNFTPHLAQWGLENNGQVIKQIKGIEGIDVDVKDAWSYTMGNPTVIVGVLDTGIDIHHKDLSNNIFHNNCEMPSNKIDDDNNGYIDDVTGWDFYNNDNTVFDSPEWDTHGTTLAGVIAAKPSSTGVVGVAPYVQILPLKFMSGDTGSISQAINAIKYAEKMGVKIINCSWGTYVFNKELYKTIKGSNILFVCAAGNELTRDDVYPACFDLPNIISVAAINNIGQIDASNYGYFVDVAAPGVNIYTTYPNNDYDYSSGSSIATAFVSGVAALLCSSTNNLSPTQAAQRIINRVNTLDSLKGKVSSQGIVNAYKTMSDKVN